MKNVSNQDIKQRTEFYQDQIDQMIDDLVILVESNLNGMDKDIMFYNMLRTLTFLLFETASTKVEAFKILHLAIAEHVRGE